VEKIRELEEAQKRFITNKTQFVNENTRLKLEVDRTQIKYEKLQQNYADLRIELIKFETRMQEVAALLRAYCGKLRDPIAYTFISGVVSIIFDENLNEFLLSLLDKSVWKLQENKKKKGVKLLNSGEHNIKVIKVIRVYTDMNLKEAKEASERLPWVFTTDDPRVVGDLNEFKGALEEVGATVEMVEV
jgi:hypothetical protein